MICVHRKYVSSYYHIERKAKMQIKQRINQESIESSIKTIWYANEVASWFTQID